MKGLGLVLRSSDPETSSRQRKQNATALSRERELLLKQAQLLLKATTERGLILQRAERAEKGTKTATTWSKRLANASQPADSRLLKHLTAVRSKMLLRRRLSFFQALHVGCSELAWEHGLQLLHLLDLAVCHGLCSQSRGLFPATSVFQLLLMLCYSPQIIIALPTNRSRICGPSLSPISYEAACHSCSLSACDEQLSIFAAVRGIHGILNTRVLAS